MNLKRAIEKINVFFRLNILYRKRKLKMKRLGTKYGGWKFPDNFINQNSVCYLAGAGLDISFDVELVTNYNCSVFIFDPTPKAKEHFFELREKTNKGEEMKTGGGDIYEIEKSVFANIFYEDKGLWKKEEIIKFYEPEIKGHISHSILNLQKTDRFFEGKVERLSAIMKRNKHKSIDLLKLDIEGAEYEVIKTIKEDKLNIKVICIEFDEIHKPLDSNYIIRIKNAISILLEQNYILIDIDKNFNYTFVKKNIYTMLR